MPFFSRPVLDNLQFKQLLDSTLTLSGQTQIATISGFSISDGSIYIPIIVTGATAGDVLTYNGTTCQIILQPGGGSSGVYSGASPTTCTVGGLLSGSSIAGCTISCIIESIVVPDIPPSSSLSVATGGIARQFGDCSVGDLCYCGIKHTNPLNALCLITNGTGIINCIINPALGNTCTGIEAYTYPFICAAPSSACTQTSVNFSLDVVSCTSETSSTSASITWQNKRFSLVNSAHYYNSAINTVLLGTTGELSISRIITGCTMIFNNQFFYYAYPKAFGLPAFCVNGVTNTAWGNPNTCTLFTVTFVNTDGYSNLYYVSRSDNRITGTYNIKVS
jgi:hypothetical protein